MGYAPDWRKRVKILFLCRYYASPCCECSLCKTEYPILWVLSSFKVLISIVDRWLFRLILQISINVIWNAPLEAELNKSASHWAPFVSKRRYRLNICVQNTRLMPLGNSWYEIKKSGTDTLLPMGEQQISLDGATEKEYSLHHAD